MPSVCMCVCDVASNISQPLFHTSVYRFASNRTYGGSSVFIPMNPLCEERSGFGLRMCYDTAPPDPSQPCSGSFGTTGEFTTMNGRYGFRVDFEEANGMTVYVCCQVISHAGTDIESEPPSCSCPVPTQPTTMTSGDTLWC